MPPEQNNASTEEKTAEVESEESDLELDMEGIGFVGSNKRRAERFAELSVSFFFFCLV